MTRPSAPRARRMPASVKRVALTGLIALAIVGCHAKPAPPPPPPVATPPPWYTFCIEASERLNWYDQSAHTLYLRLFPLSSLDGFLQAEMEHLLDPKVSLPGLEATPIERTVYPGSKVSLDVPLKPGVDFLGVIAGYYRLEGSAKSHRRLVQIGTEKAPCMRLGPNAIEVP